MKTWLKGGLIGTGIIILILFVLGFGTGIIHMNTLKYGFDNCKIDTDCPSPLFKDLPQHKNQYGQDVLDFWQQTYNCEMAVGSGGEFTFLQMPVLGCRGSKEWKECNTIGGCASLAYWCQTDNDCPQGWKCKIINHVSLGCVKK